MERASLCPGRGGEEGNTLAICSAIVTAVWSLRRRWDGE